MEDKGGKNLHLEHLEDEIINYGVDGGRCNKFLTIVKRYVELVLVVHL